MLPLVREAYIEEGCSDIKLAERFEISRNTVREWRKFDLAQGVDWEARRQRRMGMGSMRPLDVLNKRLNALIMQRGGDLDDNTFEARMSAIRREIIEEETRVNDVDRHLEALGLFAKWCRRNLTDADVAVVRKAVDDFCGALRTGELGGT